MRGDDDGLGCLVTVAALVTSLAWLGLMAWLVLAVIDWLGRH